MIVSAAFLCVGIILRFWGLNSHPQGLDIDEASILYWAGVSLRDQVFPLYSPQATHWEMLPGYLYYPAYHLTGMLRLWPALLGTIEIALMGLWVGKSFGRNKGWLAAALLAVCPWHFYYSRIVGTCTGVIALFLLTRLVTKLPWALAGLLYYTTYRLVWIRELVEGVLRRDGKKVALTLGSLAVAFALIALSPSDVRQFFFRGTYNFSSVRPEYWKNYLFSASLPFAPLPALYRETTDRFVADYVHTGLTATLAGPALGWGLALLSAFGLIVYRRKLREEILFLGGIWLVLGFMGPSYSRFLLALPVLVLAGALACERVRLPGTIVALGLTLFSTVGILRNLGNTTQLENLFHARHQARDSWIRKELLKATPDTAHLIAEEGFSSARYWAWESGKYSVYGAIPSWDLQMILSHGAPKTLFWDTEVPRRFAAADPLASSRVAKLKFDVVREANVLETQTYSWGEVQTLTWNDGNGLP